MRIYRPLATLFIQPTTQAKGVVCSDCKNICWPGDNLVQSPSFCTHRSYYFSIVGNPKPYDIVQRKKKKKKRCLFQIPHISLTNGPTYSSWSTS